jgi:GT2 family glycosyltransferase
MPITFLRQIWRKRPAFWRRRRLRTPQIHGAKRLDREGWRATAGDPQILLPRTAQPLTLILRTQRAGGLTPRLYFDWGMGFSQAEGAALPSGASALLAFDFAQCADLRALRLDPFEGPGDFALQFESGAKAATLAREVEAAWAADPPARAIRADVALRDYAPARGDRALGRLRAPVSAQEHFLRVCALAQAELAGRFTTTPATPLISLVCPTYDTPTAYLDDLLASFRAQIPGYAELVLSDDGSTSAPTLAWCKAHAREPGLVILRNGVNRGIAAASNAGIAEARGAFIGFIDHDDALAPHAIAVLARAIEERPQVRFFYTDEVIADGALKPTDFFDKPAFDDVLLSGVNYINHLSLYRRDVLTAAQGFREGYEGSQDYDLLLRALKPLSRDEIAHVPYPAYIWRRDGRSFSVKFLEKATANARRALAQAYGGPQGEPSVARALLKDLHRVRFDAVAPRPKVSVVVPNRDSFALIREVADGLFRRTDYPDFELIVVDNGTTDPQTLALYVELRERPNFTLHMEKAPFNFSAQVNNGVALATGEALLLLNNDVEVLAPDWLAEMVGCLAYPDVGVVGARLLYPDRTLQHAGVVVGLGDLAGHWYVGRQPDFPGPMGRLAVRSAMTAVTGACMLISRPCWDATGGFDETGFAVAYNDVDFCLRARSAGFRTLYTPFATLVHHESASRGDDARGPNRARFLRDQAMLMERHGTQDFLDPVLSPWSGRDSSEPARITLEKLPPAR